MALGTFKSIIKEGVGTAARNLADNPKARQFAKLGLSAVEEGLRFAQEGAANVASHVIDLKDRLSQATEPVTPEPEALTPEQIECLAKADEAIVRQLIEELQSPERNHHGVLVHTGDSYEFQKGEGPILESHDPSTGELIWSGNEASPAQVTQALDAANEAFDHGEWRHNIKLREECLTRFAEALEENEYRLAAALSIDTGKPKGSARGEAGGLARKARGAIKTYKKDFAEPKIVKQEDGTFAYSKFEPYGVVVEIAPFNVPLALAMLHISAALMAGNTVVLKLSEKCPVAAAVFMDCVKQAGFPPGVINIVQGGAEVGKAMLDSDKIKAVVFTGSHETGDRISQNLGPHVIRNFEMSGNNPAAVDVDSLEDHEIVQSAYMLVTESFKNSGQLCVSPGRLILAGQDQRKIALYKEALKKATQELVVAPWNHPDREPFMGPLIDRAAADQVFAAYERMSRDADIIVPMTRPPASEVIHNAIPETDQPEHAAFLMPGVIEVKPKELWEEGEVFGPLLVATTVPTWEEAIALAKEPGEGLIAGVHTNNHENAAAWDRVIRAGIKSRNHKFSGVTAVGLPFGALGKAGTAPMGTETMNTVGGVWTAIVEHDKLKAANLTGAPDVQALIRALVDRVTA